MDNQLPTRKALVEDSKRTWNVPAGVLSQTNGSSAPAESSSLKRVFLRKSAVLNPEAMLGGAREDAVWPSVAGYEILGELGRGNMGVVYKARQVSLNRLVALKMVRTGAHAGQQELKRFLAEAQLVARLQHPNFVQVFEVGVQDGLPFFSMELIEGGNLKDKLAGKPLPFRQAARLICTLAQAMGVAHQNGVVHRDLKPANILLGAAGSRESHFHGLQSDVEVGELGFRLYMPKITDFGLAKQLQQDGGQTESGVIMGTPNYMAPEQAEGRSRDVGPPADVYALGAILYELLTGQPPYNAESPAETILQIFHREPISPSRLQPRLPRDLETICLRCLQKDPHRRYATAQELADDIGRFLASEPIVARPASPAELVWKWARRHPVLATVASCGVMAVMALVGLSLVHQADLEEKLIQARADEGNARKAEEDAQTLSRLAELRAQGKELLHGGERAIAARDWRTAEIQLLLARDKLSAAPELSDLKAIADRLLGQATLQVTDRKRYQSFLHYRDQALFHATLFTGTDLATSLHETRTAAAAALSLFGVTLDSDSQPALAGTALDTNQQAEVRAGCYEMLMVLADAVAQPLPEQNEQTRQQQARDAIKILKRAAASGPATRAYHLRHAHFLRQAGDLDAALVESVRGKTLQPVDVLDYFLVGNEAYRQGNVSDAIVHLEKALQLQPEHFWAGYYLGLCRLKTGRPDLATMAFTTCLSRQPDFAWLNLLRASAWAERGDFANAEADFREALKRPLDDAARYALLVNRGVLRIRQERLDEAGADFAQAIALKPELYQAYVNHAQVFVKQEKVDEAIALLDKAIAREPALATLYRTRARLQIQQQAFAVALEDLDKAIVLAGAGATPAVADDHVDRGRLLYRAKNYEGAVQACESALKIQARNAAAHFVRAEALLALNRPGEALPSLDAAVAIGPADANLFCARASLHARLGKYAQAVADYTKALELEPNAATYTARGWAFLVTDARRLALPDFEQAIRLKPELGDAYTGRGFILVLQLKVRDGVKDAEEAIRRGPATPRLLYSAARIFAQAAVSPEITLRETSHYKDRAVELLRSALDLVPVAERASFWTKYVAPDTALNPIRAHARFHQLAAR